MRLKAALSALFSSGPGKAESQGTAVAAPATTLAFEPLAADFVIDPYPLLSELQDREPAHKAPNGTCVLTRYQDVLAAFSDRRLGNVPSPYAVVHRRNCERYTCAQVANNIIPFKDAPAHTGPRKFISKAFHEYMQRSAPDIESIARQIFRDKAEQTELDLLQEFATPLSVKVMGNIMGIPADDEQQLKRWSEWFFYLFSIIPSADVLQSMNRALDDFRCYFKGLIAERRANPTNDLLSTLANTGAAEAELSDEELIDHCMLIFSDGVENVDSGIANAVYALLKFPQQLELLLSQPELCKQAVDECLRFESPGQFIGRVALEDLELHGTSIKKGTGVLLLIGAANRDPRQFDEPHKLDIQRNPNPYLSFGKGRHACIGASLVKQEMDAALKVLLPRLPLYQLNEQQLEWEARLGHRWIGRLPISLSGKDR